MTQTRLDRAILLFPPMLEPTVLLVTDEAHVRSSVKAALRERGYRVLAARSSLEAFVAAAKHSIDALIAKVDLPGVRGPALERILTQAFPGLPVLYLQRSSDDNQGIADQLDRIVEARHRRKPAASSAEQRAQRSQSA